MLSVLFTRFFHSEKSGGIILIFATALSLTLTNIGFQPYINLWSFEIAHHSIVHWINDGLMVIFFLLIGLELERELYAGELSNLRNALLPVFAATGGMLVPAGFYMILNSDGETSGAGIPMATDIAFALGVLSMLGRRVPASLKVFLTALAVIDDLGAIVVIAIFYTDTLNLQAFGIAMGIFGLLLVLNRLRIHNLLPYLIGGVAMWYFMLSSGVHATITGVLLAFAIPFGSGGVKSPSYILQNVLHTPVAFVILPLFALANTAMTIDADALATLGTAVSVGIAAGLLVGKPAGIMLFTYLATVFKLSAVPSDLGWGHILGGGLLAGIGFTMSIFITLLAFDDQALIDSAKLSIMLASLISGLVGFVWLKTTLRNAPTVSQK